MSSARYGGAWQTKTRRQNMLVYSQRVSVQEASATAAKPRYGRVVRGNRGRVTSPGSSEKPSSGVLDELNSSDNTYIHTDITF